MDEMPVHCAAAGCSNRRNEESKARGITFHHFPKDGQRSKAWELACQGDAWSSTNHHCLCSQHFHEADLDRTGQTVRLRENAMPSIFPERGHLAKEATLPGSQMGEDANMKPSSDVLAAHALLSLKDTEAERNTKSVQTDLTGSQLAAMEAEIQQLKAENAELRQLFSGCHCGVQGTPQPPAEDMNKTADHKMSSGLKERLKKSGRFRSSPLSSKTVTQPTYRQKLEVQDCNTPKNSATKLPHTATVEEGTEIVLNTDTFSDSGIKSSAGNGQDISEGHQITTICTSQTINTSADIKENCDSNTERLDPNGASPAPATWYILPVHIQSPGNAPGEDAYHEDVENCKKRMASKEEKLRKLRMVKMYRVKNDLKQLESLIKKWRVTSQQALMEIVELAPEPKPTLRQLIDHLQLDYEQLKYNPFDGSFS